MNEQQHLEEVIGRFLQNTRENEEISKEEAIYLKRRIRPAMEYLIVQENIDGMKKMADRGWFGEQELNGFLTRAGELKKWDAFRCKSEFVSGNSCGEEWHQIFYIKRRTLSFGCFYYW